MGKRDTVNSSPISGESHVHSSPLAALCPVAVAEAPTPYPHPLPHPAPQEQGSRPCLRPKRPSGRRTELTLSFTLPGDIRSAVIGRTAIAAALKAHGPAPYVWPTTRAASELIAVTARMTPGRELYVSLRHRGDAVRLLVWDQHPRHAEPDTAALCEARRRRALWLLAAVVDDWGGEWGVCEAPQPHRGTKSWVACLVDAMRRIADCGDSPQFRGAGMHSGVADRPGPPSRPHSGDARWAGFLKTAVVQKPKSITATGRSAAPVWTGAARGHRESRRPEHREVAAAP